VTHSTKRTDADTSRRQAAGCDLSNEINKYEHCQSSKHTCASPLPYRSAAETAASMLVHNEARHRMTEVVSCRRAVQECPAAVPREWSALDSISPGGLDENGGFWFVESENISRDRSV
jgi:CO dehydrogenase/acetyl-CoA synthase alpha subunit